MNKKILTSGIISLFLFSIQNVFATSFFFDFFKEIKAPVVKFAQTAPKFPWWFAQSFETPAERLAPQNTGFRDPWQPEPKYLKFRPNTQFNAQNFYKNMRDRQLNPINDISSVEEDQNLQSCSIEGSILSYDQLPQAEITNRCCECNTNTGDWDCEYPTYNASSQQICSIKDLEVLALNLVEDSNFVSSTEKRYLLEFSVVNHANNYDFQSIDLSLIRNDIVLETITLNSGLEAQTVRNFEHFIFSNYLSGVVLSEGSNSLGIRISSDEEEASLGNNEAIENIIFSAPKSDFSITAFTIDSNSGIASIFVEISNLGELGSEPTSGVFQLFANDGDTPIYEETISNLELNQALTISTNYTTDTPTTLFSGIIIADDPEKEKQLDNNTFEQLITN